MALDLTLLAIPHQAGFIIEKARQSIYYATDLDKILNTNELKQQLRMVELNPAEQAFENSLTELINDSVWLKSLYPGRETADYVFKSKTRGYDTLNYLIRHHIIKNRQQADFGENIFTDGADIDFARQHTKLVCISSKKAAALNDLLNTLEFAGLLNGYDYNQMTGFIYKLTIPENLDMLEAEFNELKRFYRSAKALDAFIMAKVD